MDRSLPTIIKGEPTVSSPVRTAEDAEAELMEELSDAGLKATVVFHNLTPAELYEKVLQRSCTCTVQLLLRSMRRVCIGWCFWGTL